jgi:hypothetical protein
MVRKREPEEADWTAARRRTEMKWWMSVMVKHETTRLTMEFCRLPKSKTSRALRDATSAKIDAEQLNIRWINFHFVWNRCISEASNTYVVPCLASNIVSAQICSIKDVLSVTFVRPISGNGKVTCVILAN